VVRSPENYQTQSGCCNETRAGTIHRRATETHKNSDQVLLVIEDQLSAEIDGKRSLMKVGDFVSIPPRTKHKFTNRSNRPAVAFNVYSPPEYPPDTKG